MPFTVRADVIDIGADSPSSKDRFLVDTNVWLWLTYDRLSTHHPEPPQDYQLRSYPTYLKRARDIKADIYVTPFTYAELAGVIEKAELEIYRSQSNRPDYPLKVFRHESEVLYGLIVGRILDSWDTVDQIAKVLNLCVTRETVNGLRERIEKRQLVDAVDLLVAHALIRASYTQFLTDDIDFSAFPGIQVFTANKKLLSLAKDQGRLRVR